MKLKFVTQWALLFVSGTAAPEPVASGSGTPAPPIARQVIPGITVLLTDSIALIRGKRVGLITNHTGRDERGHTTIDLLHNAPGVRLTALFAPEHGIRGSAEGGALIRGSVDEATGVTIYSLYGDTKVPSPRMLAEVDVLVYDIQDVGARMYTYVWTMALAAEAAKKAGRKFIVLDRPNPIRDDIVEGGGIERAYRTFTGLHDIPLRYGLTPGELAIYLAGTGTIDADVTVIPMRGYTRSMWWEDTGLEWISPSPNIRDTEAALLYPGLSFFEATNVSEGRGTEEPFRLVGARWLTDAPAIAKTMNARRLAGVRFEAVSRKIARGEKFGGETIPMVRIVVTNRDGVRSAAVGAHLLREVYSRHPTQFRWKDRGIEELSGSRALRNAVQHGGIESVLGAWRAESARFAKESARFRLY
ncbi:MAG TPA: DUF1343 domain-containing protein [Gemmatimonadaceae bacterium]|nr:DUF1343 domain-containing protein [Gemmatimonadaceae bacterium]